MTEDKKEIEAGEKEGEGSVEVKKAHGEWLLTKGPDGEMVQYYDDGNSTSSWELKCRHFEEFGHHLWRQTGEFVMTNHQGVRVPMVRRECESCGKAFASLRNPPSCQFTSYR